MSAATTMRQRASLRTYRLAEVATHTTEHDCWIVRKGLVYDISKFLHDHPGGPEYILQLAGMDVDKAMRDAGVHVHSEGAYDILDDYLIGRVDDADASDADSATELGPEDGVPGVPAGYRDPDSALDAQLTEELATARKPLLDLSQPLLWQMLTSSFSKEYYMAQVHIPRHLPEPATIFANPFLEVLTRTPWYVIPLVWGPVVAWLSTEAWSALGAGAWAGLFAIGVFVWTLFEYGFHRFLFHVDGWLPDHPYALTVHFLMHGIHHYLPMDRMRLVLPPALFVILVQGPWFVFRAFLSYEVCCGLFAGGIAGYIAYDLTHYYLHHARVRTAHMREMKKYHLAHHYKNYELGYGITSKLWDAVFATVLDYGSAETMAQARQKAAGQH